MILNQMEKLLVHAVKDEKFTNHDIMYLFKEISGWALNAVHANQVWIGIRKLNKRAFRSHISLIETTAGHWLYF